MSNIINRLTKKGLNPKLIEEAFYFAKESYKDIKWLSGENYIDHAVRTALILYEMGVDQKTIIAGLLSNTLNVEEESLRKIRSQEIEKRFGKDVATVSNKASELNKVYYSIAIDVREKRTSAEEKIEKIRKMFFAIAGDIRVIIIKLAARIDGMNNLKQLPLEMQKIYATETQKIFSPIANRLGLGDVKIKLEDSSFEYLNPDEFKWLKENTKEKYEERQKYLEKFIPRFKKTLKREKIKYIEINYRAKSYWSAYQKLQRHNMDLEKIYDLVALRLIVKDVSACYKALGIIHKHYRPMSGQIQDYIAKPKENGYKSIHTTVFLEENKISEIQIKTEAMHREAQFGICAHWAYKEKINLAKDLERLRFAERIPEFLKTFKIDFFESEIFAFTPKGDVIVLPKGSTPIDFAYAIHSDIGNHCEAAKIDGKIIPLSRPLNNGEVVEIITSKKKQPSVDWLKFVKTGFAKSHIKKIIAVTFSSIFSVPTFIGKKILRIKENPIKEVKPIQKPKTPEVYLGGQKGIAVNFAKCCFPKTGDIAKAYIGKYGPAILHKVSCKNFQKISEKHPEKIIEASWQ